MRPLRRRSNQTIQDQNDNSHDYIRLSHRYSLALRIESAGRYLGCVASNTSSNADHSKPNCLCCGPVYSKILRLVPASSLSTLKGYECATAPGRLIVSSKPKAGTGYSALLPEGDTNPSQ